ncbi:MAG: aminotransferase class I/II-fold pyridoxal phosphate-dependent enzyme [Erysipelotrichaceae bacterium]|nr:aminotransferase class I/II-fold pyridoxal phosphate-dependent enzyme [Erysipelotrichaceae bacterium]
MYSFANDYSEGACPKVLKALIETNDVQSAGYGVDEYSLAAADLIKQVIEHDDVDVHFITGGTPCNVLAISTLRAHEAVISCESGHINVHETGAVEATGHKIIAVKGKNGKILPQEIRDVMAEHTDEHKVRPKMVFISDATEFGTIYTKKELTAISEVCKEYGLYLYLDGARLGNVLVATGNDLSFKDICDLTDIFYIGGTKNGAWLGEALVIKNDELKPDFRYLIKQHCSMLAKGRLIGVQFIALFQDKARAYLDNARNADIMAQALKYIFRQFSIPMYIDSPTNQIFPVLENRILERIKSNYTVTEWGPYDKDHTIVRFVCSWATEKAAIQDFYNDLVMYVNEN